MIETAQECDILGMIDAEAGYINNYSLAHTFLETGKAGPFAAPREEGDVHSDLSR